VTLAAPSATTMAMPMAMNRMGSSLCVGFYALHCDDGAEPRKH
jgi:hypothetical protein